MKKILVCLLVLLAGTSVIMAQQKVDLSKIGKVKLLLWTKEGPAEKAFQYVEELTKDFTAAYPNITFDVVNKSIDGLREDFQTASLAGEAPDLLWTVSDHVGPFHAADIIQSVDKLFDLSKFIPATLLGVQADGKTWGIPIYNGNHLMLLYNKSLVPKPPATTDELLAMAKKFPAGVYPLVWDQTEPFWLIPWLGAFKGKVFAADGKTPTLNTPEMVKTLQFMYDMKVRLAPKESGINEVNSLFREGKAAMIINGDWSLSGYSTMPEGGFGIARIPKLSATGEWPTPYTSAVFFMFPSELKGAKLQAAQGFVNFVTSKDRQLEIVKSLSKIPVTEEAYNDPLISSDPIIKASADQLRVGIPMPTSLEMRCVWDSLRPEMKAVLAGTKKPADAAAEMQKTVLECLKRYQ